MENDAARRSDEELDKQRSDEVVRACDVEMTTERCARFVDTSNKQVLKSGNLNDLKCFYEGDLLTERMAEVRKSIYYTRENWNNFEQMLAHLEQYLSTIGSIPEDLRKAFTRQRNWCDLQSAVTQQQQFSSPIEEFDMIYSYTRQDGFQAIFKMADNVFRRASSVRYTDEIRNAVFLLELINIDLYNYVHRHPELKNFKGVVYRGMALPADSYQVFESVMQQPINKRYISIPLGLWSSSREQKVAVDFVKHALGEQPQNVPILLKINVLNLSEDYLAFYRTKFPGSAVSSICAVNIEQLSQHESEREVLLRGAFFQAINFYEETIDGLRFRILELVMLNTNRDHYSNPISLGERDAEARALFGNMIGVTRNRFIVDYCQMRGLEEDVKAYTEALQINENNLKKLMS